MDKIILLYVENRFLKGVLLKSITAAHIGVLEIVDKDDLNLKLSGFGPQICLVLLEITDENKDIIKEKLDCLKAAIPQTPVMALVSKDTAEIVGFAARSGIKDILYIPKSKELYRKVIQDKLQPYYDQWAGSAMLPHAVLNDLIKKPDVVETLTVALKHAQRGNYPVTLVMACLTGEETWKAPDYYNRMKTCLRDTDRLIKMDDKDFLGIFPYTEKEFALVLEQKFRRAFEAEFGKPGHHINLFLFSATYPIDERSAEKLLERLKNGIGNSMTVTSIKVPLNTLSKNELESYKQKIRQYRRFM